MTRTQRSVFVAVAIVIAVVGVVLIAGGGSKSGQAAGAPAHVKVVNGQPDGGVQVLAYRKGDHVTLTVESDRPDRVHVHGYGLYAPVERGAAARFSFAAKLEGEFIVELENAKLQVAALRVRPQ